MIEVKKITKEFIKKDKNNKKIKFLADNNISFTAKGGEVVGVLGPNGAGKTTLLRIIAGIMTPTSGSVLVDDLSYKSNMIDIKKNIAFMTGNTKLYKDISPRELLIMFGSYYGLSKKEIEDRIKIITKKFNMDNFINQKIDTLSTGQYQRTAIARCLIGNPKYYIFDEPTSGLDVLSSRDILDFIREEKKNNKCILYSTHYMEEAENICDKIVMINKGKVIFSGTPSDVMDNTNTDNLRDSFLSLVGDNNE